MNLTELSKKTVIWPGFEQSLKGGSKLSLFLDLKVVAKKNGMFVPAIVRLPDPLNPGMALDKRHVLKREWADCSSHVILPPFNTAKKTKLSQLAEEQKKHYRQRGQFNINPSWFLQTYLEDLRTRGELRAFVVQGHLVYTVLTQPNHVEREGVMTLTDVTDYTPLQMLRYYPFSSLFSWLLICFVGMTLT